MIELSLTEPVILGVSFLTLRSFAGLSARLNIEGVAFHVEQLSRQVPIRVEPKALERIGVGIHSGMFTVFDEKGTVQTRQVFDVRVVPGTGSSLLGQSLVCTIPTVVSSPGKPVQPELPLTFIKNGVEYRLDVIDDAEGLDLSVERVGGRS